MVSMLIQKRFHLDPIKRLAVALIFSLLSVFSTSSWSDSLTVETDRQTVEFGDIINLYVTADFQSTLGQLNLDELKDQFEILGSQRSNNIQMVNGDFQSSTRWLIQLLPKQVGELIVPPFKVGDVTSQPYKLTVMPLQKSLQKGNLKPYFFEAKVSTDSPYVQGQVIYTLRFYYQGRLISGNIRPPEFGNALVEPLKKESVFNKQIKGQAYTVYEWVYAIYPQSSGELKIATPQFGGRIQLGSHLKQIQEEANPISLRVKPEPKVFKDKSTNAWLPANKVSVSQQWNLPDGAIHVGDTLTQTLTLNVDGLMANQLPTLKIDSQSGFKVYPDQPSTQEDKQQNGIISNKQLKRAIIPTQAGSLTLPEQTLYWWNTQTDKLETTLIPGKTFEILPAADTATSTATPGADMQAHDLTTVPPHSIVKQSANNLPWQISTAVFAFLWVATLALWLRTRRQIKAITIKEKESTDSDSKPTEPVWSEIDDICKLPAQQLYPALRQWLRERHRIQSFAELDDRELIARLQQLEASLFNQGEFTDAMRLALCESLKKLEQTSGSIRQESQLKALYAR